MAKGASTDGGGSLPDGVVFIPEVGDKVQIKAGAIDVQSGKIAKKGKTYCEGSSEWATISKIVKNWPTGSKFGLPRTVTKYVCSAGKAKATYYPQYKGSTVSIVDALIAIGEKDFSYNHRAKIAIANDIKNYSGTAAQNTEMLNLLKKGKLKKSTSTSTTVVWQVLEKDLIPKASNSNKNTTTNDASMNITVDDGYQYDTGKGKTEEEEQQPIIGSAYVPDGTVAAWDKGLPTEVRVPKTFVSPEIIGVAELSDSMFTSDASLATADMVRAVIHYTDYSSGKKESYTDKPVDFHEMDLDDNGFVRATNNNLEKLRIVSRYTAKRVYVPNAPLKARYLTSAQVPGRLKELKNFRWDAKDPNINTSGSKFIQNQNNYPIPTGDVAGVWNDPQFSHKLRTVDYDYQIIPNDSRYKHVAKLENKLMQARAELGLMVHGNNDLARSVKFYMYNRYKVPDTNLAHNKTVTHIFFTRPDLNIISDNISLELPHEQVKNHTEAALVWRMHPELFKLLTDCKRNGDKNNFNMLLSNQITSFTLQDESIATIRGGKSWNEHEIVYGQHYNNRTAGEFSCTFDETSEYSIINMLKLWLTYIDNVSSGAWSPNYTTKYSRNHAHHRALDYAASMYVFKCAPDGETILYWSKYYGVFPTVSGSGALSWERSSSIANTPSLNITFAYSMKRDMSPISLVEFNANAHVSEKDLKNGSMPAFDYNNAGSTRPFVGTPFVEFTLYNPILDGTAANDVYSGPRAQMKLKYLNDAVSKKSKKRTDAQLYRGI